MAGEELAPIEQLIVTIRGQRVILAGDLVRIYGVQTRVLNQAVKRNPAKFPVDFVFQITREESQEVQRLRSQIVTLKPGQHLKYLPYAFTEHGAITAANVLNSGRAIAGSVYEEKSPLACPSLTHIGAMLHHDRRAPVEERPALNAISLTGGSGWG